MGGAKFECNGRTSHPLFAILVFSPSTVPHCFRSRDFKRDDVCIVQTQDFILRIAAYAAAARSVNIASTGRIDPAPLRLEALGLPSILRSVRHMNCSLFFSREAAIVSQCEGPMIYRTMLTATMSCTLLMPACSKMTDHQERQGFSGPSAMNDQSAGVETEGSAKSKAAELVTNQQSAQVQADFTKLRDDFRQKITSGLTDLDHRVVLLERKARNSVGNAKNEVEMGLTQIRADRLTFTNDYKSVDSATSANWDATKARLDKEWLALSSLVDHS
jgi:hypothetical protein